MSCENQSIPDDGAVVLRKLLDGREGARTEFYGFLQKVARKTMPRCQDDLEDLVHDFILEVFAALEKPESRQRIENVRSLSAYCTTAIRNQGGRNRGRSTRVVLSFGEPSELPNFDRLRAHQDVTRLTELRRPVHFALASIEPQSARPLLAQVLIEGRSLPEIQARTSLAGSGCEITLACLESRFQRGKRSLRKALMILIDGEARGLDSQFRDNKSLSESRAVNRDFVPGSRDSSAPKDGP